MNKPRVTVTPVVSWAPVVVVTTVLLLFGLFVYQRSKVQLGQRFTTEQTMLANQLEIALRLPVWNFDHDQIDRVLDAAMGSEDVAAVRLVIVDRRFTVYTRGRDPEWRPAHVDQFAADPSWTVVTRPIIYNEAPLGTLEFYGTPRSMAVDLRRVRNTIIVATLLLDIVLLGVVVVGQLDARVAERKQAEARYREIVEGVRDVVFSLGPNGEIQSLNPAFERLTGWPPDKWIGQSFAGLLRGEDSAVAAEVVRANLAGEETVSGRIYRILCADGRYIKAEVFLSPSRKDGQITGLLGIGRDVTDRFLLEEQLRQSQKMEAVGRLAGGVAHDFNNLLTIIQGRSSNLVDQLSASPDLREEAEEIDRAAESAASLTRQLLAFSRQQVLSPTVVDFGRVIGATERMLRRLVGANIRLVTSIDQNTGHVRADVGQIEQVLVNLVVNARDAMPDGGTLRVRTEQVEIAEAVGDVQPGRYAKLAVRDSGVGMDPSTRARVFEPFFTTKGAKGTGLGLSTVYGIVTQSGGTITVESEPGRGTTFTVLLPVVDPPTAVPVPTRDATGAKPVATILLVEDIDSVRSLMAEALKRAGHTVIAVADAESAIEVYSAGDTKIDLLVTDLMMPDIGGRELADRLRAITPGLRVLYVSGYSANDAKLEVQGNASWYLQKPFTPKVFLEKVNSALRPGSA